MKNHFYLMTFIVLGSIFSYRTECQNLSDGVVAYWNFDETSGTTLIDQTNNRNGTVQGAVTINQTGKLGRCILIDANSEYVSFASLTQTTGSYSFWCYVTNSDDDRQVLSSNAYYNRIFMTSSNRYPRLETSTNGQEFQCNISTTINAWHHIVFTRNSSDLFVCYIDGVLSCSQTISGAADLTINQIGSNGRSFYGYLDEIGIWNRALSSSEVTSLYNSGTGVSYPFGPTTNYTLTATSAPTAGGTVTLSPSGGTYASGTSVTASANTNSGYTFTGWSGALTGTTNPGTVIMNSDKTLTANFTAVTTYSLTITTPTNGAINASPVGPNYVSGTTVTLTATPASGYQFSAWTGAVSGTTNPTTLIMDGNKTASATFAALPTGSDNLGNHTATQNIRLNNFWFSNDGENEGIKIEDNGNVGIGIVPTWRLSVKDIITIFDTDGDQKLHIRSNSGYGSYTYWAEAGVAERGILGFNAGSGDLVYRSAANTLTSGTERFRITSSGNVGIGTSSPGNKLDIYGGLAVGNGSVNANTTKIFVRNPNTGGKTWAISSGANQVTEGSFSIYNWTDNQTNPFFHIDITGNVGIGTTSPNSAYKLDVFGKIRAQEIVVNLNSPAADYVFNNDYNLMSLKEVEQFVKLHNHLPGIPSAATIKEEGLNMGEMENLLLQKVEELTLYLIQIKKENEELKIRIDQLEKNR